MPQSYPNSLFKRPIPLVPLNLFLSRLREKKKKSSKFGEEGGKFNRQTKDLPFFLKNKGKNRHF